MEILYPKKRSEFEIQAKLYSELKKLGYDVRGEVKWIDDSKEKGFKRCSFDLIIFEDKKPKLIIEVKKNKGDRSYTRQFKKYNSFGVKLIYYFRTDNVNKILEALKVL